MNSSARNTALSFLASLALGAAVFMGCTVGSGTVDDTDGGTQNNDKDSGGTTNNDDAGTTPETDSGEAPKCESGQRDFIGSAACQACLENSCCSQLQGCYNITADAGAGEVDCNDYTECIDDIRAECNAKGTQQEIDECFAVCDTTAAPGVVDAYNTLTTCGETNCATDCQ